MYYNLVRSEFYLNKRLIYVYVAMVVAVSALYPLLVPEIGVTFALGTVYLAMLPATLIARQSKFRADSIICTLPVTRKQIIVGKYLFAYIFTAIELLLFLTILIVAPFDGFGFRTVLEPDRIVNSLFTIVLIGSVLMPLIMRFGFTGVLVLLLGINVITVILFALTATGVVNDAIGFVIREIPRFVRGVRAYVGAPSYHLLLLATSAVVAFLSLTTSVRVYQKREF